MSNMQERIQRVQQEKARKEEEQRRAAEAERLRKSQEEQKKTEQLKSDPRREHMLQVAKHPLLAEAIQAYFDHFVVTKEVWEDKKTFFKTERLHRKVKVPTIISIQDNLNKVVVNGVHIDLTGSLSVHVSNSYEYDYVEDDWMSFSTVEEFADYVAQCIVAGSTIRGLKVS